jgi:hypothetical protein
MKSKSEIQMTAIRQFEDLVKARILELGPIMDDYDGGQKAAYERVLNDINAYRAIIKHTSGG